MIKKSLLIIQFFVGLFTISTNLYPLPVPAAQPLQTRTTNKLLTIGAALKDLPKTPQDFFAKPRTAKDIIKLAESVAEATQTVYGELMVLSKLEDTQELMKNKNYVLYLTLTAQNPTAPSYCQYLATSQDPNLAALNVSLIQELNKKPLEKWLTGKITEPSSKAGQRWSKVHTLLALFKPYLSADLQQKLNKLNDDTILKKNANFFTNFDLLSATLKLLNALKVDAINPVKADDFMTFLITDPDKSFMRLYNQISQLQSSNIQEQKDIATELMEMFELRRRKLTRVVLANDKLKQELMTENYFGITQDHKPGKGFDIITQTFSDPSSLGLALWGLNYVIYELFYQKIDDDIANLESKKLELAKKKKKLVDADQVHLDELRAIKEVLFKLQRIIAQANKGAASQEAESDMLKQLAQDPAKKGLSKIGINV